MVSGRPYKVPMLSASQLVTRGWERHQKTGLEAEF
jgi:hypothetical protein